MARIETKSLLFPILVCLLFLFALSKEAFAIPGDNSIRFPVIIDKTAHGSIIIPENASSDVYESARELQRCLHLSTKAQSQIIPENDNPEHTNFLVYLGNTNYARKTYGQAYSDENSFLVATQNRRIILYATDTMATRFAVSYFSQRYLKFRWFIPGELGESVPDSFALYLKSIHRWHNPSFVSRQISGLGPYSELWSKRNYLYARFRFSHNLAQVFSNQDYTDNPGWAPLINGHRSTLSTGFVQPDFTNPQVIQHSVDFVNEYFTRNPNAKSVSLGINDNLRFDQGTESKEILSPIRFFRTRPVYTDLYIQYLNNVARDTQNEFPDKYLGCLAYYWTEQAPSIPVNHRIIPYITSDRSLWFDPAYADEDTNLIKAWKSQGSDIVGIYDYYYGRPYFIPRYYPSLIAKSLKAAHKSGARAFYAEALPVWAFDGPKIWLATQLLWDVDQNADKLLDEYFTRYYGESAKPMKWFHFLCEKAYLNQTQAPRWIRFFKNADQVVLFSPETRKELRNILEQAKVRTRKEITRNRLQLLDRQFFLFETFCAYSEKGRDLAKLPRLAKNIQQAFSYIKDYAKIEEDFFSLIQYMRRNDHFNLGSVPESMMRYDEPLARAIWQTYLQAEINGNMDIFINEIASLAESFPQNKQITLARDIFSKEIRLQQVLKNSDIEVAFNAYEPKTPFDPLPIIPEWFFECEFSQNVKVNPNFRETPDGTQSLQIQASAMTMLTQNISVQPGEKYIFQVSYKGHASPGNFITLAYQFFDSENKKIGYRHYDRIPYGDYTDWNILAHIINIPPGVHGVAFSIFAGEQDKSDLIYLASPRAYKVTQE